MDVYTILAFYAYGWVVSLYAVIEECSLRGLFIAAAACVFWPVIIPGAILKRLLR